MSLSTSNFNSFLISLLPENLLAALESFSYLGTINVIAILKPFFIIFILSIIISVFAYKKSKYRIYAYLICGIFIARITLFGNPISWYAYNKTLDWKDIGFRQKTVISSELRKYFIADTKYLAIGSSQTGAIYGDYAKTHENLYKIEFSGMGPAEYFLYRELVSSVKPEYVLLYLSEFDFGRPPAYSTFRYAPAQGFQYIAYIKAITSYDTSDAATDALKEMLIASFFPEYKYSFVFKGYLSSLLKTNNTFDTGIDGFSKQSKKIKTEQQVKKLRTELSEEYLDVTFSALELFVNYCEENNITIIIVEGHYNPLAYSQKNASLNKKTRLKTTAMAERHNRTFFIPREKLMELTSDDFVDAYHMSKGMQYTKSILAHTIGMFKEKN